MHIDKDGRIKWIFSILMFSIPHSKIVVEMQLQQNFIQENDENVMLLIILENKSQL